MSRLQDLTGKRFGRLVVLERAEDNILPSGQHKTMWKCVCDCGGEKITTRTNLVRGITKSCGCYALETRIEQGHKNAKHHGNGTRIYRIYRGMCERCYNKNASQYPRYGARGIAISKDWLGEHGFERFREWAFSNGYSDDLTIDRINNNESYSPTNCRWATNKQQSNNRRTNVFITYNGETHTLAEWSEITGINVSTIKTRYRRGWNDIDILTRPIRGKD